MMYATSSSKVVPVSTCPPMSGCGRSNVCSSASAMRMVGRIHGMCSRYSSVAVTQLRFRWIMRATNRSPATTMTAASAL